MNGHDVKRMSGAGRVEVLDKRLGELLEQVAKDAMRDRSAGRFIAADEKDELIAVVRERLVLAANTQASLELAVVQLHSDAVMQ